VMICGFACRTPLTFKAVVAVHDLAQFQYKLAELLRIYSLNFFLLLEVEI